jgi:predicted CXXCH cytochrome family protein
MFMKPNHFKFLVCVVLVGLFLPIAVMARHSDYGCDGCHAPHNASRLQSIPLYGGSDPNSWPSASAIYDSNTLDLAGTAVGQTDIDGMSKMCLSCHDGTDPNLGTGDNLGTDMSNTHPISFVYDSTTYDNDNEAGLHNPGTENVTLANGATGTVSELMTDDSDKVQCHSCHDVHSAAVGMPKIDNATGDLCKACHDK